MTVIRSHDAAVAEQDIWDRQQEVDSCDHEPVSDVGAPSRLFHSIVVAGAALGASCRTPLITDDDPGRGGAGGSGTTSGSTATTTKASSTTATGTAVSSWSGSRHCHPASAVGGCADPTQYHCFTSTTECPLPPNGGECVCDETSPASPFECAATAQFTCESYDPVYQGCWCDEAAPLQPSDCSEPDFFVCYDDDPPIGCHCLVPIA